jgi:hypothetical protein
MRSEFENEMLALELVNDRVKLKGNLHAVCVKNKTYAFEKRIFF